mmetsp:Transcript_8841/g.27904  ORF Transcript_8841/g.27904 Transcript_8841/m.27904 type:complete len:253 (-) Transcript_8841:216-974(-)
MRGREAQTEQYARSVVLLLRLARLRPTRRPAAPRVACPRVWPGPRGRRGQRARGEGEEKRVALSQPALRAELVQRLQLPAAGEPVRGDVHPPRPACQLCLGRGLAELQLQDQPLLAQLLHSPLADPAARAVALRIRLREDDGVALAEAQLVEARAGGQLQRDLRAAPAAPLREQRCAAREQRPAVRHELLDGPLPPSAGGAELGEQLEVDEQAEVAEVGGELLGAALDAAVQRRERQRAEQLLEGQRLDRRG